MLLPGEWAGVDPGPLPLVEEPEADAEARDEGQSHDDQGDDGLREPGLLFGFASGAAGIGTVVSASSSWGVIQYTQKHQQQ